MHTLFRKILKGLRILAFRLRTQGLRTTATWLYARGIPKLTGVPLLRYSAITPEIFVGPQYGKRGKWRLERADIRASVNLRTEFDDAAHGLALDHYCHLPTVDDDPPSLDHLQRGVDFIEQMVEQGQKVYIHCAGGVGRAPTLAAAYFVRQGMTLNEALALIKQTRPFINIVPAQLELLREWEVAQQMELALS